MGVSDFLNTIEDYFNWKLTNVSKMLYEGFFATNRNIDLHALLEIIIMNKQKFPTIAEINHIMEGMRQPLDDAYKLVESLLKAVGLYGRYQAVEAREELPSAVWALAERAGGWISLCDQVIDGIARAQLRDMAMSVLREEKASKMPNLILLEGGRDQALLS